METTGYVPRLSVLGGGGGSGISLALNGRVNLTLQICDLVSVMSSSAKTKFVANLL